MQQPRIGLDVARLVHHLGCGVKLRVEVGHGLDDLGGRDQRALLAMHELGNLRSLQVMANLPPLFFVHAVPQVSAIDVDDPVVEHHRVFRIEVERPVDAFGGVPLLLLALGIELQQRFARLVVLPGETGLAIAVEFPFGLLDWQHIAVSGRHRCPPGSPRTPLYGIYASRLRISTSPAAGSTRSSSPVWNICVTSPAKRSTSATPPKAAPCARIGLTRLKIRPRGTMPRAAMSCSIHAVATPPFAVSRTRMRS